MKLNEVRQQQVRYYGLYIAFNSDDPNFNPFTVVGAVQEQFGGLKITQYSPNGYFLKYLKIEQIKSVQQFVRRRSRGSPRFTMGFRVYVWVVQGGAWAPLDKSAIILE